METRIICDQLWRYCKRSTGCIHYLNETNYEEVKKKTQRFLYVKGRPGSGKTAVLIEGAVRSAKDGLTVLILCPTGALVCSLRELHGYRHFLIFRGHCGAFHGHWHFLCNFLDNSRSLLYSESDVLLLLNSAGGCSLLIWGLCFANAT